MTVTISLLAIPLALTSNLIISLGYILQKKAAQSFPKIETKTFKQNLKTFFTNPIWVTGLILTVLSFPISILAYSYGNIAIVNAIGGGSIVFIAIFSKWLLKEKIGLREYLSLALILIGVSTAGYFGSSTVTQEDFQEFWNGIIKLGAIIFFVIIVIIAQSPLVFSKLKNVQIRGILYALAAGIYMSLDIIAMKGLSISLFKLEKEYLLDLRFLFIGLIAIIAPNVATIMLQYAYQKHKAVVVIPIYNNLVLILPIIFGAFFLGEWSSIDHLFRILFSISLTITVTGTIFISMTKKEKAKERVKEETLAKDF